MKHGNYIRLQGRKVYFEQYFTKESPKKYTLLLIHGFLACTYCYRRLIPYLSAKYDVYCLDLIGFGKSEKPADFEYSYKSYAELVQEFIKTMGLKNVILVGHSMGGQICLYTTLALPTMVHSLVLICCSGYLGKTKESLKILSYLPLAKPFISWWMCRQNVEKVLGTTLFDQKLITQEMVEVYSKPIKEKDFCNTIIGLIRNREGDLGTEILRDFVHPILLIWGEEDKVVPLNKGIQLRSDLKNSELVVIPEAGHQVMEEKPEEVYEEIVRWIANLETRKGRE